MHFYQGSGSLDFLLEQDSLWLPVEYLLQPRALQLEQVGELAKTQLAWPHS
jgi:hypothetical protein